MKKFLLFASAVAVLFSSCSTDNTTDVIGTEAKMGTITANAAYQQDGTRTHLEGEEVFWCKGDAIGVFAAGTPQVQFGLIKGEDTASGTFAGNTNYLTEGKAVYAYYPYTRGTDIIDGTEVKLEIMAEQTYRGEGTFDAAQAPAYAAIAKLEDKSAITFDFKGAASYLNFPVTGYGVLESLTLSLGDQVLAGVGTIDVAGVDDPQTKDVDETPYLVIEQGEPTVKVNCGGIVLNPNTPVNILFVVPTGVSFQDIELTAKLQGFDKLVPANREIESAKAVTKRNVISTINADAKGNAWSFQPEGYFVIDDAVSAYGLEGNDLAALNFITYAYLAQEDTPAADSDDWKTVFGKLGKDAWMLKAMITAEEIDFEAFDAKDAFQTLGAYDTESKKYPEVTVYKNALTWYIENENAIETLYWGENGIAVVGVDPKNPAVINGLTVLGNGITASAGLENIKFTNSAVIVEDYPAAHVGFIAPTSTTATIKDVVIGAGNFVNALEANAEYYVGGIYGTYAAGTSVGVTVEELPQIVLRENGSTWAINKENVTIDGFMMAGQIFGSVYVGNAAEYAMSINLDDYKVASLDEMPAIFKVSANAGNVLDITAKNVDATIDNVVAVNGDTETTALASIVINGVSYWNGTSYAPVGAKFFTAEELAYVLSAGNSATITLTHDIDMQCVDTKEESKVVTLTHYQSSAFNVNTTYTGTGNNKVYNEFEIKNLIGKTVDSRVATLFGYTANVSNVTLSNVTVETGYVANYIAGLAYTGNAQNVVINDLTINVGKAHNKATTIGGVFGTAVYNSVKDVTVNSCAINYEGDVKSNVGIIAGTLTINPDATETLDGVKISSNKDDFSVSKNFGEWWTKGAAIANFKSTASYAGRYPFGVVNVANAQFGNAGNIKAYLAAKDCQSWSTRLAAGVVFADTLTSAAADKVEFDTTKEYKYAFYLNDGLTIGNNNCTVFGFSKK